MLIFNNKLTLVTALADPAGPTVTFPPDMITETPVHTHTLLLTVQTIETLRTGCTHTSIKHPVTRLMLIYEKWNNRTLFTERSRPASLTGAGSAHMVTWCLVFTLTAMLTARAEWTSRAFWDRHRSHHTCMINTETCKTDIEVFVEYRRTVKYYTRT